MSYLDGNTTQVYKDSDFLYEVGMNRMLGKSLVNKFGFNEDVDVASGEEIIAAFGGNFLPSNIITTAQTFTITYNNTTDGLGQSGATMLLIDYLDVNYDLQQGVHVLGSTGSDVTAFTGFGINRVVVIANGGAGWNVNDITFTATTLGSIQALVPALTSVTQQVLYHTPINYILMVNQIVISVLKLTGGGGDPRVILRLYSYSRVTLTRYLVFQKSIDTTVENTIILSFSQPFNFGGREVIYLKASTDKDNTSITARLSGVLEIVQ